MSRRAPFPLLIENGNVIEVVNIEESSPAAILVTFDQEVRIRRNPQPGTWSTQNGDGDVEFTGAAKGNWQGLAGDTGYDQVILYNTGAALDVGPLVITAEFFDIVTASGGAINPSTTPYS